MARNRFIAPPRQQLPPDIFAHPIFAVFSAQHDLLTGSDWPTPSHLNNRLGPHQTQRFVTQDETLLRDGLHYETRIHEHGHIATRPENWHDLFNALIWMKYPAIKQALNARQVADIAHHGPRHRSRAQCALTHFDEAGAVVWVASSEYLDAWDQHHWRDWFGQKDAFAQGQIRLHIFGHALLEHALQPNHLPTAKCLVVCGGNSLNWATPLAKAITSEAILLDPQELRPLPLAGWPGWSSGQDHPDFYSADCFRPLRAHRTYPAPLLLETANQGNLP